MIRRFALACCVLAVAAISVAQPASREIAITIDDLPWVSVTGKSVDEQHRLTDDLLGALTKHGIPAIGFVNEQKLQPEGVLDDRRVALLRKWIDAGLDLGNHTFSHPDLHTTPLDTYLREIERGDAVTRKLLSAVGKQPRYFRHPFLRAGRSLETKRSVEGFLTARGYHVAPVSVDNYDYVFAAAFDRVAPQGEAKQQEVAAAYLLYMTDIVAYYEQQSMAIVGREIRQISLLHANALNARMLDPLARMLKDRGYKFITLDRALEDPAYKSEDTFVGPGGITWLHRWALTQGKRGKIFAGEPAVPEWIERAAAPPKG